MNIEKAVLKHIFESKSLEFYSQIKPEYFQKPVTKTIFKALRSYINTFHKIPDIELFKTKLEAALPIGKRSAYIGFLDGLELEQYSGTPDELLHTMKEHYVVSTIDDHIEELVETAQNRDVEKLRGLIHQIDSLITTSEKLPEDMADVSYSPSTIKLVDPFLPTMQRYNLKLGGLTIVGGGSGSGKSIFTLQQLMHSYKNGANVCLLNLELGLDETIARMYSMDTGENFTSIYGNTDPATIKKVEEWKSEFFNRENKFYIKNTSYDNKEIETIIRAMVKRGVHEFAIDYLNLVEINTEEEWRGLSKLVKNLHRLTQELACIILTPTQVNIQDTKEKDGELKVTTRGSRELEFSATVFLFIYQSREEYEEGMARIFTIKARNASKKTYVVKTNFAIMAFEDTGMVL